MNDIIDFTVITSGISDDELTGGKSDISQPPSPSGRRFWRLLTFIGFLGAATAALIWVIGVMG